MARIGKTTVKGTAAGMFTYIYLIYKSYALYHLSVLGTKRRGEELVRGTKRRGKENNQPKPRTLTTPPSKLSSSVASNRQHEYSEHSPSTRGSKSLFSVITYSY